MNKISILLLIILAGCAESQTDIQLGQDFKKAWAKLENTGKIVKLDRSKSLLGTDANNDGIRDDIREVIDKLAREEGLQPKEVRAVEQTARKYQSLLNVNLDNEDEILNQIDDNEKANQCLWYLYDGDIPKIRHLRNTIKAKTLNTKERTFKYFKYEKAMNGRVFSIMEGNTCE